MLLKCSGPRGSPRDDNGLIIFPRSIVRLGMFPSHPDSSDFGDWDFPHNAILHFLGVLWFVFCLMAFFSCAADLHKQCNTIVAAVSSHYNIAIIIMSPSCCIISAASFTNTHYQYFVVKG